MVRILIEIVLPFLGPFLAFGAYRLLVARGRGFLDRTPWFVLTASGLVLACASLASWAFTGGEPPGGQYIPPHIEDGRVVPGEVKPR